MYASVRHALLSALVPNNTPTATFMLLPSWHANSVNGYMKLCHMHPASCTILGTIPSKKVTYTASPFWINAPQELPQPTWNLHIIAIWNEAAKTELNAANPGWLDCLKSAIPDTAWHTAHSGRPNLTEPTSCPFPGTTRFNHLRLDSQLKRSHNRVCNFVPLGYEPLSLKVTDWKQWAYTDGSCITVGDDNTKEQRIGAGVYDPLSKLAYYVSCGGQGITNTINRAELTGIAAALAHRYTDIATDSACSLAQIRHQLLHPQRQRRHLHANLLASIVKGLQNSPGPVRFHKVKSHTGIAGNECADAIAKHAALHDTGHDVNFPIEGNPYTHLYWLAADKVAMSTATMNNTNMYTTTPANAHQLFYLHNLQKELKDHMHQVHKLGRAKDDTAYFTYYKRIRNLANLAASNAFMLNPKITKKERQTAIQYRTNTLYNQKHAVWFKRATAPALCPLCHQADSALHILSGCQHQTIRCQVTERHNLAGRLIYKALSKGALGAGVIYTDIGSTARLEQQGLSAAANNRTLPAWLFPNPTVRHRMNNIHSRPDLILVVPIKNKNSNAGARTTRRGGQSAATAAGAATGIAAASCPPQDEVAAISAAAATKWDAAGLTPDQAHVHLVEIKYCEDTRPETQLAVAKHQHQDLISSIRRKYKRVTLHTILLGVGGLIYKAYTDEPLQRLGLDRFSANRLVQQLHTHSIQYAAIIVRTRRGLEFAASASNPHDPH